MPTITFSIDESGETSLSIKGIKGVACKPIHIAVSDDLRKHIGIPEITNIDTDEAKERPLTTSKISTVGRS
jgi:hypothetical protein